MTSTLHHHPSNLANRSTLTDASLGDSWHETYLYCYFNSLCESRSNRVRASTWLEWSVRIKSNISQNLRMWEHIYSTLFLNSSNILLRTNAFSYSSTNVPIFIEGISEYFAQILFYIHLSYAYYSLDFIRNSFYSNSRFTPKISIYRTYH